MLSKKNMSGNFIYKNISIKIIFSLLIILLLTANKVDCHPAEWMQKNANFLMQYKHHNDVIHIHLTKKNILSTITNKANKKKSLIEKYKNIQNTQLNKNINMCIGSQTSAAKMNHNHQANLKITVDKKNQIMNIRNKNHIQGKYANKYLHRKIQNCIN